MRWQVALKVMETEFDEELMASYRRVWKKTNAFTLNYIQTLEQIRNNTKNNFVVSLPARWRWLTSRTLVDLFCSKHRYVTRYDGVVWVRRSVVLIAWHCVKWKHSVSTVALLQFATSWYRNAAVILLFCLLMLVFLWFYATIRILFIDSLHVYRLSLCIIIHVNRQARRCNKQKVIICYHVKRCRKVLEI